MRRIGLITLFRDNYGSELQCYATKRYIESHGIGCDVIYLDSHGFEKAIMRVDGLAKSAVKAIRYRDYLPTHFEMKHAAEVARASWTPESKWELDYFANSVLQPKGYELETLEDPRVNDEYDYFIVGSDQIWSGTGKVDPFRFLEFADDEKKIALSVSFGTSNLRDFNAKDFRRAVSRFENLTVREREGVDIVKNLTGRIVPRLADPVMLLDCREWTEFAEESGKRLNGGYIFVHFLDAPNESALHTISLLAQKENLSVCVFGYPRGELDSLGKVAFIAGSPYDYVHLIENATYVCTDSFHTSQFSIIFNRAFMLFDRNYAHNNSQSSRISTVLDVYDCHDRLITNQVSSCDDLPLIAPNFDNRRLAEQHALRDYLDQFLDKSPNDTGSVISTELSLIDSAATATRRPALRSPRDCTGCMACVAICPKKAIGIKYSEFGYRLPVVNMNSCVGCGMCEKACGGTLNETRALGVRKSPSERPKGYIAYSKSSEILATSASGGAFATLAASMIDAGGVAVGSCLSIENGLPVVRHVAVSSKDGLESIMGSKYVESECTGSYATIAQLLSEGKSIIFCGTSCQVAALRRFALAKKLDTTKLFTVDLVCHGVPGADLFSRYIAWLMRDCSGNLKDVRFRSKVDGHILYSLSLGIENRDKMECETIPSQESTYYRMFLAEESYRDACYHCEYASLDKPADITVGDYFEAREDYPELFAPEGKLTNVSYINCILVHNEKGRRLLAEHGSGLDLVDVDPRKIQASHKQLCRPGNYSAMRLRTMDAYARNGICGIEGAYKKEDLARNVATMVIKPLKSIINASR